MERKKRSKGSVWEFCYANKIFGTFGVEMRAFGQKFVKLCTLTHTLTHAAKLVVRLSSLPWASPTMLGSLILLLVIFFISPQKALSSFLQKFAAILSAMIVFFLFLQTRRECLN